MIGGTGPDRRPDRAPARRARPRRHDPAPRHARTARDAARSSRTSTPTRTTRQSLAAALGDSTWDVDRRDVRPAAHGRAARPTGRCEHFVSVGGVPAYRGWTNAWLHEPVGLPVPVREDAPLVDDPAVDEKGYRIVRTEEAVFAAHPSAAHFRYPYLYGPYQPVPREWSVVRRDPRRPPADRRRRRRPHAPPPLLHRELRGRGRCSASSIPSAARARSSTSATRRCSPSARWSSCARSSSAPSSRSCRCRTTSRCRRGRCSRSRCRRTACSTSRACTTSSATATSCPRAEPCAAPRAGSPSTRPSPAGIEEQVLTDPFDYAAEDALIDSWLAARRRGRRAGVRGRSRAGASRTAGPRAGRARTRSSPNDAAPHGRRARPRPVDRADRPVRGRAARRPGRDGDQGRAARASATSRVGSACRSTA